MRTVAVWAFSAFLMNSVVAGAVPGKDQVIDDSLRALYNLDYTGARDGFASLVEQSPGDPVGHYGLTTTLWWELTNEYDEKNPLLEKEFLAAAERTVSVARAAVKNADPSGLGHLCWGGALGLVARWNAIEGHWWAAYRNGKQAFDLQTRALQINPQLDDAYLGPGIFHYYVAVLPSGVKALAHWVFGGSKTQGLEEIHRAMDKGRFSRTAARLFLVNIFVNNERDPDTALAYLREGRKEFPDSAFFHLVELMVLDEAHRWDELDAVAQDFLSRLRDRRPGYGPSMEHRVLYLMANATRGRGQTAQAVQQYSDILSRFHTDDRWITLTHLHRGMAFDLLGKRSEALADYKMVLARRDVWQLHDKAKERRRRPYEENKP